MCPQPKPWTHRNLDAPTAGSSAQLAADRAWLAKCVADRRRQQSETGTLHTHRASLLGSL